MNRLHLIGDADLFDLLSELARRIGYEEVHRSDDAPAALDADDHVLVAAADPARARKLVAEVMAAGDPGYVGLCSSEKEALVSLLKLAADRVPKAKLDRVAAPAGLAVGAVTADEQAIAVAAGLIAFRRRSSQN